MKRTALAVFVLLVITAHAQESRGADPLEDFPDAAAGQNLFEEAHALIQRSRFDEACPKLEESDRLERAVGTEYNLAVCYELSHHPASARRMYVKVAIFASQSGKESTAKDARDRAKKLDAVVPRLVLKTPNTPAGLRVRCDDQDLDIDALQKPVELDPGPHHVVATAEGFAPFDKSVTLDEGETKEMTLLLEARPAPSAAAPPPKAAPLSDTTSEGAVPWRWVGLGVAAVGAVGAGVGGYFALHAKSERDGSGCRDGQFCPDEASAERLRGAKSDANLATVFVVGGSALLVAGVVLFVVAPSPSRPGVTMAAAAGPRSTGLQVFGSW